MRFIFLDLDDTILDFHRAERQALSQTLRHFHVDPTDAVLDRYHVLNRRQWELLEEGKLTRPQVLVRRFQLLFDELGIRAAPQEVCQLYEEQLAQGHFFVPGAQELLEALEEVWLKDWVLAQPLGLDTDVGDAGQKLSGGQRQKIGIARALLCQAEYILFDEATSSVDRDSEQEIWNCIGELAQTRTLLIISHRLSTIRSAHRILVVQDGRIAEQGSHARLLAENGAYARLYHTQNLGENHG